MSLIDKKELKEWVENWFYQNKYYHPYSKSNNIPCSELYDILERMPTINAVEAVRCKECKRWTNPIPIEMKKDGYGYCGGLWTNTHKDDFCVWGERRSDGNTAENE